MAKCTNASGLFQRSGEAKEFIQNMYITTNSLNLMKIDLPRQF